MRYIFFRRNCKRTSDFLEIFSNGQTKDSLITVNSTLKAINSVSKSILTNLENSVWINSQIKDEKELFKQVKYLQNKVKKTKNIDFANNLIDNDLLNSYNLLVSQKERDLNNLEDALDMSLEEEIKSLVELFSEDNLLLFRNIHLKKKLLSKEKKTMKLRKKELVSLYKYGSQISLKTGSLGRNSELGFVVDLVKPTSYTDLKKTNDINIHGYLQNRIYREVLIKNIASYKRELNFNNNYIADDNGTVKFKVLMDDTTSNIFCGLEREVKLRVTNNILWLMNSGKFSTVELLDHFSSAELEKLIRFGIVKHKHLSLNDSFSWLNDFNMYDTDINTMVDRINSIITKLEKNFSSDHFSLLEVSVETLCKKLEISTLNFPLITVDRYATDPNRIASNDLTQLEMFNDKLNDLSRFYSIFDASKKIGTLANEFMIEKYPNGVSFASYEKLDNFLKEMAESIFKTINLGALRSGFFEFEEYPVIKKIVSSIIDSGKSYYIISKEEYGGLLKLCEELNYDQTHGYSFFLQPYEEGVVVNHVYKGYGVFSNRYKNNIIDFSSNSDYGCSNLLDIPYYFGFNANERPLRKAFDPLNLGEYDFNNICYRDITIKPNKNKISFYDNDNVEFHFSFLGSMTPMVLPKTIAMFNSLCLTGGMYFDIGDLILRQKFESKSDSNFYESPRVCFDNDKIIIAREKYLFRSSFIEKKIHNTLNKSHMLIELIEIFKGKETFFLREFSVDDNFKNKFEKPVYINLISPISLEVFFNYIKDIDWFVVEEIVPDIQKSEYLSEYIVESQNS